MKTNKIQCVIAVVVVLVICITLHDAIRWRNIVTESIVLGNKVRRQGDEINALKINSLKMELTALAYDVDWHEETLGEVLNILAKMNGYELIEEEIYPIEELPPVDDPQLIEDLSHDFDCPPVPVPMPTPPDNAPVEIIEHYKVVE